MLTYSIHDERLTQTFSDDQAYEMIGMLLTSMRRSDPEVREIVQLATWGLASQRISSGPLERWGEMLIDGIIQVLKITELESVALSALVTIFSACPALVKCTTHWFTDVFQLIFSKNVATRKTADTILNSVSELMQDNDFATDSESMAKFIALLSDNHTENLNMLNGWGHLMILFGNRLHRTGYLNKMLSLAQESFNSGRLGQRIGAFKAWRRLIFNFSIDGHLYNKKRIQLILLPIWNSLKFEKSFAVRQACFETFMYLLFYLSHNGKDILRSMFQSLIVPAMAFDHTESRLQQTFVTCISRLLIPSSDDIISSTKFELLEESSEGICQRIGCAFPSEFWTAADFKALMHILTSALPQIDETQDQCAAIWKAVNVYVQAGWEANHNDTLQRISVMLGILQKYSTMHNG